VVSAIATTILSLAFLPVLMLPTRRHGLAGAAMVARHLLGTESLCRHRLGDSREPTPGPVLVASKHMSMWDTMALYLALDAPATVLKRELLYIPSMAGFCGRRRPSPSTAAPARGALRKMSNAAQSVLREGRPILIFPEGTRKKPGAAPDYKPGVAGLYAMLDVECVPVALNSGVHWTGFLKRPGTIVLEFLEPIAPGLKRPAFMALLEERIETATNRLLAHDPAP
jgi:1-acyl-sn-glycerol-3-phosphate acyltransferase